MAAPGLSWPHWPGWDHSHGFPLSPAAVQTLELLGGDERDDLLHRLEAVAFAELVRLDIAAL